MPGGRSSARRARPSASVSARRDGGAVAEQLDRARPPRAGRRRCRARGWRASSSRRESSRLDPMGARDLAPRPPGRVRRRGRRPRRRPRAGRRGAARRGRAPRRGRRRRRARARPSARSRGRPACRARASRCRRGGAPRRRRASPSRSASRAVIAVAAAPPARDEQRLLDLEEEVAPLVRGRAVDAETDAHARVEQRPHGGDAGAEPQVRRRAVRDAGARARRTARPRRRRGGRSARTRRRRRASRAGRGTRPGVQP